MGAVYAVCSSRIVRLTGAFILLLAYGYQVKNDGPDPIMEHAFESVDNFGEAALPGAFLVDVFPIRTCYLLFSRAHSLFLLPSPICAFLVPGHRVEEED